MPKIRDKHTKAQLNKQQKYQRRQKDRGRCRLCPNKCFQGKGFCITHYTDMRLTAMHLFDGAEKSRWPQRKKRVLTYVIGCLYAAMENTRPPFTSWQEASGRVHKFFFADYLNHRTRDQGRLNSIGRWIYRWDRRLRRKED